MAMTDPTHIDERGRARMVDVGEKPATARVAVAEGRVRLGADGYTSLASGKLAKGDAWAVARVAGIQAAKRTAEWIPLCHPIPLDKVEVEFDLVPDTREVRIRATAAAHFRTGVEMEALTAVAASGLTLYDMVKAVDRGVELTGVRLLEKHGGRSGSWTRDAL